MKREEIEVKIAELQAQLKELDKQVEYGDLKAGDRFKWCGLIFVKLKNGLALLDDLEDVKGKYCIFDPYDNDYEESMIKTYINSKFLKINNINVDEVDYATLLSKEEYEENKDIIIQLDYCWWLRSPYLYYPFTELTVSDDGVCYYNFVNATNFAVRAAFNLKLDTKVSII